MCRGGKFSKSRNILRQFLEIFIYVCRIAMAMQSFLKSKNIDRLGTAVVFASLAFGMAACDRSDAIRAELKAREATWSRELSALRKRQQDDAARLSSLSVSAVPGDRAERAARAQLNAAICGRRQSLADLQLVLSIGLNEVEERLAEGERPAVEALDVLTAQMKDGLKTQEQELATASDWLRISSGTPETGTVAKANR
jgi:hypothetical protein